MSFLSSYASSLPVSSPSPLHTILRPVIFPENKLIILFFALKPPLPPEQSPNLSAGKQDLFSIFQDRWSFIMSLLFSHSLVLILLTKLFCACVFPTHCPQGQQWPSPLISPGKLLLVHLLRLSQWSPTVASSASPLLTPSDNVSTFFTLLRQHFLLFILDHL